VTTYKSSRWRCAAGFTQTALQDLLQRIHDYWRDNHVPEVDAEGYALETSSKGKVGERFTKPKRRTKESR
jgi:hypothetical protein